VFFNHAPLLAHEIASDLAVKRTRRRSGGKGSLGARRNENVSKSNASKQALVFIILLLLLLYIWYL
jgi:hypothetical protein